MLLDNAEKQTTCYSDEQNPFWSSRQSDLGQKSPPELELEFIGWQLHHKITASES